ncbi:hypothetical protein ACB098_04G145500 [Castanea mollissima]
MCILWEFSLSISFFLLIVPHEPMLPKERQLGLSSFQNLPLPILPSSRPFQRNPLNFSSIALTTSFGSMKILDQYICMQHKTDCMRSTLPENESFLAVQDFNPAVIFIIRG